MYPFARIMKNKRQLANYISDELDKIELALSSTEVLDILVKFEEEVEDKKGD